MEDILVEEIFSKLNSLNLINIEEDLSKKIILMSIQSVKNFIKCEINPFIKLSDIKEIFINITIGEYLKLIKNCNFNQDIFLEDAIKSISEGDTSISYLTDGKTTKEQRFDNLILYFLENKKFLNDFKSLRW